MWGKGAEWTVAGELLDKFVAFVVGELILGL
jgi:hypothetical protein